MKFKLIFNKYWFEFLTTFQSFVKMFTVSIVLSATFAAQHLQSLDSTLTLSRGQVIEINGDGIKSFAIGNKEIIGFKYEKKTNKFYLSAQAQGYSELKLLGSTPKTIDVYVLSKTSQLKLLEIKNILDAIGLKESFIFGQKIILNGEIQNIDQYISVSQIIRKGQEDIINNLKLQKALKKEIISNIYYDFFQNYLDEIFCEEVKGIINCSTTTKILENKEFINAMNLKHGANFYPSLTFGKLENYQVDIKIFQIEKLDGSEINFGLDQINANLNDIFENGPRALLQNNSIELKNQHYDMSTLATPKAIIKLNEPLSIKVGSEIPFTGASQEGVSSQTKWKFAGLSLNLTMEKENNQFKVKYETNLSRPIFGSDENIGLISGNSQKSSFSISLDKPIEIFEIDLKTDDEHTSSVPFLDAIPVLKNLFRSKGKSHTNKKIVAIVRIIKKEL